MLMADMCIWTGPLQMLSHTSMKTLTCTSPGNFNYSTTEQPELLKDHAIIKLKRVGICGTDLHAFEGTQPFFSYPRVLGDELSGELMAVDGNDDFRAGERVTIIPYFNCGQCIACRMNKPNCCVHMQVFGVHVDGGMREYISVPSRTLLHGNDLSYEELALVEPLAIGAHGIRRAGIQPGEFVLVIGAGPIGLGTMEFARIAGAKVIALDVNKYRLAFCKDTLGVAHVIDALDSDVLQQLSAVTGGDMPTVVIDATGNQKAINNAINYMAHGARFVLIGLQKGDLIFNHPEFHKREATLMSSRNATTQDFEHVIRSMKAGLVNPTNYITHKVPFEAVKEEFSSWLDPRNKVIKAMIEFD
jgi:2-desacetyl-2-hydroxyethyl bacteriochlorophyllide A dehydrogenase